jgi:hypothetical protein
VGTQRRDTFLGCDTFLVYILKTKDTLFLITQNQILYLIALLTKKYRKNLDNTNAFHQLCFPFGFNQQISFLNSICFCINA